MVTQIITVFCFREFLTGFHKRKLQRKKYAREKFEKELKEERKRLKAEAKNSYKKLVVSQRTIPELETLLKEEYKDDLATVRIEELCTADIAKDSNWVGENKLTFVKPEEESEEDEESVPGMEIKPKKKKIDQPKPQFETERDLKKLLKKEATKKVKNSKVFKLKNKLEKRKQQKNSNRIKKQRISIKEKKSHKKQKR